MKTQRRLRRPIRSARALVANQRSTGNDLVLATVLAGIAGAANAGGFFALGQYTSHMTGYLSQFADNIALLNGGVVTISLMALSAFIAGAGFSTFMINYARDHKSSAQYAWPLAIQGAFMLCFSFGGLFSTEIGRLFLLACLCFIMGMQNATITKISRARIRTTHTTGMITDIGIEVGRAVYAKLRPQSNVQVDGHKLRTLLQLVLMFLLGGIVGAVGYGEVGFFFSLPLALILLGLGVPSILKDRSGR